MKHQAFSKGRCIQPDPHEKQHVKNLKAPSNPEARSDRTKAGGRNATKRARARGSDDVDKMEMEDTASQTTMDFGEAYDENVFMREALAEAKLAAAEGEVPVGCVLICPSSLKVVGRGRNKTNEKKNATRHCELEAIDDFLRQRFGRQLTAGGVGASISKTDAAPSVNTEAYSSAKSKDLHKEVRQALSSLHLYVTCEPCVMCAWAIRLCGISRVYFGCMNSRFGGCGSVLNIHAFSCNFKDAAREIHVPQLVCKGGVFKEEAVELLRSFYSRGNPNAPVAKRKRPLEGGL